jgi:hypothetical protein
MKLTALILSGIAVACSTTALWLSVQNRHALSRAAVIANSNIAETDRRTQWLKRQVDELNVRAIVSYVPVSVPDSSSDVSMAIDRLSSEVRFNTTMSWLNQPMPTFSPNVYLTVPVTFQP